MKVNKHFVKMTEEHKKNIASEPGNELINENLIRHLRLF